MSESPKSLYGSPSRGITGRDVELAADALLREGERPTIEKIRGRMGRGSPNTINPLLDAWWKRLASRLDAGPAALHRIPESVAHVAEALWMQALEEGRRRAELELTRTARGTVQGRADLDVRSHVLSLREGELESRLRDRERSRAALEAQVQDLTVLLRKEQATREMQAKQITSLEEELLARTLPPKRPRRAKAQRISKDRAKRRRAAQAQPPAKPKAPSTPKAKKPLSR
jgi:hypothetical protein